MEIVIQSIYIIKGQCVSSRDGVEVAIKPTKNGAIEEYELFDNMGWLYTNICIIKVNIPTRTKEAKNLFMRLLNNPENVKGEIIKEWTA